MSNLYSPEEDAVVTEGFKEGHGLLGITKLLVKRGFAVRSASSVRSRGLALGLSALTTFIEREQERRSVIAQDERFIEAMNKAIEKGLESPPIGVFKDNSAPRNHTFYSAMKGSGCGSPSALCEIWG